MAAINDKKAYRYRMDGMAYALRIVEGQGIEALKQEVKTRGAVFIPLEVTREATMQVNAFLADRILNTFIATALFTIHDKFGFGQKRLLDFYKVFGHNCDMVSDLDPFGNNYEKISDYAKILKEKYGIDINIEKITMIEDENTRERGKLADLDYIISFLKEKGYSNAAECLSIYSE